MYSVVWNPRGSKNIINLFTISQCPNVFALPTIYFTAPGNISYNK